MKKEWLSVSVVSLFLLANAAYAEDGAALALKYRCNACHKADKKSIGPSYREVAQKYAGNAEAAAKIGANIKNGSKGIWGTMPMAPNKSISDPEMKAIVSYVLSVK